MGTYPRTTGVSSGEEIFFGSWRLGRLLAFAFAFAVSWLSGGAALATTIAGGDVSDQTWTPAGNPYIVQGDITVPSGAFLVIQAGTIVQIASNDSLAAGLDTARVEITVKGTLDACKGPPRAP